MDASLFRLPELQEELQKLIQQTDEALRSLPKPPSADPLGETLHLISAFVQDLSNHVEGTPNEQGLLQAIRPAHLGFKSSIRATAPNFKARRCNGIVGEEMEFADAAPAFLRNEEDTSVPLSVTSKPIYIDEVMKRADK